MIEAVQHERTKYQHIYAGEGPRTYGHSCHGKSALPIVQKWMPLTLVDVGCGWNEFSYQVRAAGFNATGVDFACPGADVIAEATALPFPNKHYDALTAFDMLEHVLPEQVDAVLAEFARVSRRFIFSISYVASVIKWRGENLHPTVRDEAWWLLRIMRAGGTRIAKEGRYITGEWAQPLRLAPDTRIILVGNGPGILNTEHGEAIDAFDEVVRFNTYHMEPEHERHIGTKTTLYSTFGRGTVPVCGQRPERVILIHDTEAGKPAWNARELYRIPMLFYNSTRKEVQRRAREAGKTAEEAEALLMSSGLLVTCWLLDVVGVNKIALAGFDHFNLGKSAPHHYWQKQTFGKPKEHDGAVEAALFAEMQAAGRVEYLTTQRA